MDTNPIIRTGEKMSRKPKKDPEAEPRVCANPECDVVLDPEWADSRRRYCSRSCRNRRYYTNKGNSYHKERYKREQAAWRKSATGKKADFAIRRWTKLPRMFK